MTTITETHNDSSASENSSTNGGVSGSQPKPSLGVLWLAILALVAVVGLVAVMAFDALGSSSDTATVTVVDPRADADFHRESAPAIAGLDSDYYRAINQHASKEASSGAQFSAGAAMNQYLADSTSSDASAGQDSDTQRAINQHAPKAAPSVDPDPRTDADHHREA